MNILAIDPGSEKSALVLYDHETREVIAAVIHDNWEILGQLGGDWRPMPDRLVIEMVASYGMAVGREVFETVYWIGRFAERWSRWMRGGEEADRLVRRDVKMHLCGNNAAKDGNIRAALLDKFGGKDKAIGNKKAPGPLYGIKADEWQALALAVTYAETVAARKEAA